MSGRPLIDEAEAHFQRCMGCWVQWMHGGDSHRLGFPSRDSVSGNTPTNYMVSDEDLGHSADEGEAQYIRAIGQAVEACMTALFNFEANAVQMHYGIVKVWMYPQYDQLRAFNTGIKRLRELIAKRC